MLAQEGSGPRACQSVNQSVSRVPGPPPSTVRELPSRLVDRWVGLSEQLDDVAARNALLGLQLVDTRAGLLNAEAAVSGDRYLFLQQVYLQRRDFLINDGVVEDDFGDFGDYDDY